MGAVVPVAVHPPASNGPLLQAAHSRVGARGPKPALPLGDELEVVAEMDNVVLLALLLTFVDLWRGSGAKLLDNQVLAKKMLPLRSRLHTCDIPCFLANCAHCTFRIAMSSF